MRVMVMVRARPDSEAGRMPGEELLAAMGRFNEDLIEAGVMLAGEGLQPSSKGKRVRFAGGARAVIDEPAAEARELIAGCWLWQVKSMDKAVAWARRCPNPLTGDAEIEIRPLFEAEDFGEELAPALREQEQRLRAAKAPVSEAAAGRSPVAERQIARPREPSPQRAGAALATVTASRRIAPCLWFDSEAEPAAQFYTSIFPNSRISSVSRYGEAGFEHHGRAPGTVLTVALELDGQPFTALNGGPLLKFNEAISLQVNCETQAEIDHYWARLSDGGDPQAQQCGWLKDRYGLSWQVVPTLIAHWMSAGADRSERVMRALLGMKKLDLAALERAFQG